MSTFFGFVAIVSFFTFLVLEHWRSKFNPFGAKSSQIFSWCVTCLFVWIFFGCAWALSTAEVICRG